MSSESLIEQIKTLETSLQSLQTRFSIIPKDVLESYNEYNWCSSEDMKHIELCITSLLRKKGVHIPDWEQSEGRLVDHLYVTITNTSQESIDYHFHVESIGGYCIKVGINQLPNLSPYQIVKFPYFSNFYPKLEELIEGWFPTHV